MKRIRGMVRKAGVALCPGLWRRLTALRAARAERRHWDARIADVLACADNARLERVSDAGKIEAGFQVMHNGLKVLVNGYYGDGITRMLAANRGCHEPQEEVVFDAIVRTLPAGAVMMEAGAYWGFYSMWFSMVIPQARVYLIEPAAKNLEVGQRNFQKNAFQGDFTHAYVGRQAGRHADNTRIVSIGSLLAEKGLERLDLLHADIQGFELEMLQGAEALLTARCVDYLFISTHSMQLHEDCAAFLTSQGYRLLDSVNPEESHSADGVLVACSSKVTPPIFAPTSKKSKRIASPSV